MTDQAGVDQSVMRWNMCARFEQGKQDRRRLSGQAVEWNVLKSGGGDWAPFAIFLHALAVLPEVKGAPIIIADKLVALHVRLAVMTLQIGPEGRMILQNAHQFAFDVGRLRFEAGDPIEFGGVVELDLRQAGKIVFRWLLEIDTGFAEENTVRPGRCPVGCRW